MSAHITAKRKGRLTAMPLYNPEKRVIVGVGLHVDGDVVHVFMQPEIVQPDLVERLAHLIDDMEAAE